MDSVRYALALFLLVMLLPLLSYWFMIHPLIGFWRKLGPVWTFSIIGFIIVLEMVGVFWFRKPLLKIDFGTRPLLMGLGVIFLGFSAKLRFRLHDKFGIKALLGLPEIAPDRYPNQLVTEGLHSKIRHPRYAQFSLALIGYSVFVNFLSFYITLGVWILSLWVIVILEERELRERFGKDYENYCRRVPRFIPRITWPS